MRCHRSINAPPHRLHATDDDPSTSIRPWGDAVFRRDPEKAAQRQAQRDEKRRRREEWSANRKVEKEALAEWRATHPAEKTLNTACMMRAWPTSKFGETSLGPILGGHAEFVDAGAHKAWTATRLVGGVATGGASLVAG